MPRQIADANFFPPLDFLDLKCCPLRRRRGEQHRSVATLLVLGYIAYAANNFIALVHLNCKVKFHLRVPFFLLSRCSEFYFLYRQQTKCNR